MTIDDLLNAVREYCAERWPADPPVSFQIKLAQRGKIRMPLPDCPTLDIPRFIPTSFQDAILEALEGKAKRTDALGAAVGDRSRLYKHPGGLRELREAGLVDHHPRLGYFRPDAPPQGVESQPSGTARRDPPSPA